MKRIFILILLGTPTCSFAQLVLGGSNIEEIVTQSLSGSGVSISNVEYSGNPDAIAYFQANTNIMTLNAGLLMTTGSKFYALGPNTTYFAGIDQHGAGSPLIDMLHPGSINRDAATIEFDVVTSGSILSFIYQFGSEEYPEYVNQEYNDAFGIFINGNEYTQNHNIATLPNGSSICINNINVSVNPAYYAGPGNYTHHQYDGFTWPLTATANVTPGLTYHITLVIADLSDAIIDSGVFIKEGSITASLGEGTLSEVVNLFFNPDNQHATIEVKEFQDQLTYSISDLSGKVLTQSTISGTTAVDMSEYASGMYLIRVEGKNGSLSKKVMR